ncbi:unnamed protein product, partial [Prorocentrum cordatum]
ALGAEILGDALAFPFGQAQWARALKAAALACNLSLLGEFSLRRLRRGGVSRDLLFKARPARRVRGGRANEQFGLLDLCALSAAELAAADIGAALADASRSL